jgi:hypothetical protein
MAWRFRQCQPHNHTFDPKDGFRKAETNLCDSLELWSPFSKMQVLNWRKAPVTPVVETAARPHYFAPPEHVEHKPHTPKQTSVDQTRRKSDRKRPPAKRQDRKQPPQLGIELIDNPPLEAVPSDQQREPAPNAPTQDHKPFDKDAEYPLAESSAGDADIQPETTTALDNAGEK